MRLVKALLGMAVQKGLVAYRLPQTGVFIRAQVPGDDWWNKIPFETGWLNA